MTNEATSPRPVPDWTTFSQGLHERKETALAPYFDVIREARTVPEGKRGPMYTWDAIRRRLAALGVVVSRSTLVEWYYREVRAKGQMLTPPTCAAGSAGEPAPTADGAVTTPIGAAKGVEAPAQPTNEPVHASADGDFISRRLEKIRQAEVEANQEVQAS